jgi:hypothetical protein
MIRKAWLLTLAATLIGTSVGLASGWYYRGPVGALSPNACFGYFPPSWQPWHTACPIVLPSATPVAEGDGTTPLPTPRTQPIPPAAQNGSPYHLVPGANKSAP